MQFIDNLFWLIRLLCSLSPAACIAVTLSVALPSAAQTPYQSAQSNTQSDPVSEQIFSIEVAGKVYEMVLTSSDEAILPTQKSTQHYAGKIQTNSDGKSWARLSRIQGKWQGMLALEGKYYSISANSHDPAPMPTNKHTTLVASALEDQHEHANGMTCGPSHSGHGMSTHQQKSFAAFTPSPHYQLSQEASFPNHSDLSDLSTSSSLATAMATANINTTQIPDAMSLISGETFECEEKVNGVCLVAEVEFAFDQLFQSIFGELAEDHAMALINMVEGIYLNNFNIAFKKSSIHLLSQPLFTTSLDADAVLQDIFNKKQNNQIPFLQSSRSIFHFVTGRDFTGSTVGFAFLDTLCSSAGVGTSQLWQNQFGQGNLPVTAIIVAHELGHNFGSGHDGQDNSCGPGHIMQASITLGSQQFSECSKTAIANSITSLPNSALCLDYPADVRIESTDNPNSAIFGVPFYLDYTIALSDGILASNNLLVEGNSEPGTGIIYSATLDGYPCDMSEDQTAYSCNLGRPSATAMLQISASVMQDDAAFVAYARASNNLLQTEQLVELTPDNNFIVSVINQTEAYEEPDFENPLLPEPETVSAPISIDNNVAPSSQPSSSGGGSIQPLYLLLLALCLGKKNMRDQVTHGLIATTEKLVSA